jgi:hypothetical protein
MRDFIIPDLTFKNVQYSKHQAMWDLRPLLYRGGAGTKANLVASLIKKGAFGAPIVKRIPLVIKFHEHIEAKLAGGGSRGSAGMTITRLRQFFSWVDSTGNSLDLQSVEDRYIEWTDHLLYRKAMVGDIKGIHVYQIAVAVAKILDTVLQLRNGLLAKTRIRRLNRSKTVLGTETEKQNLEQVFSFGHALLDIADALSFDAIRGRLPVPINFRSGQVYEEWLRLNPPEKVKSLNEKVRPSTRNKVVAKRNAWHGDATLRTRFPLVNLRIQAEILIFISQTGMNLAQVHTLKMCKFRYCSHLDGYHVYRVYKGRRQGEVAFEIFSEYREIFERYLAWRTAMFPDDENGLLFPLVTMGRAPIVAPTFSVLRTSGTSKNANQLAPTPLS